MDTKLHIVALGDLGSERTNILQHLRMAGYEAEWNQVTSRQEFESALSARDWDLILRQEKTRARRVEAELREKVHLLERSNAELDQFASIVSHDLKEPLRTISSYTDLLIRRRGEDSDPDAREFAQYICSAVGRMRDLIDALLAYSRLMHVSIEGRVTADAQSAVSQALDNLKWTIEENGARITVSRLPRVMIEPAALSQVFQNLIANSIKYRRADAPPEIRVTAVQREGEVRFAIHDNGMGVQPQHYHRIFELFRRLHGDDYPGLGIGLAMCKRMIERHGGRIWLESKPGAGSTFYFTLREAEKEMHAVQ